MTTTDSTPWASITCGPSIEPVQIFWRLHFLTSPDRRFRGRRLEVGSTPLRLGRAVFGDGGVAIDDPLLSREHMELRLSERGDAVDLRDLGSRNGTFRAGIRVSSAVLGRDAVLRCGSTVAILEADLDHEATADTPTPEIPGHSAVARKLRAQIALAAAGSGPVALLGPTGAGKEFAVKELIRRSDRSGALMRLSCAGLTPERLSALIPDLIDKCANGWLVLDDLLALPIPAQAVLPPLFDFSSHDGAAPRVVCISAEQLADFSDAKRLRPDIWARLRPLVITMPGLQERRADLVELADAVVSSPAQGDSWRDRLDADVWEALALRAWPYGLHELCAELRKVANLAEPGPITATLWRQCTLDAADLQGKHLEALQDRSSVSPDAELLRRLLKRYAGNVERVAEHFGRHRKQVYRWMDRAGIGSAEIAQWRRGS